MISWIPSEMRWLYHLVRPYLRWPIASFICIAAGSFLALLAPLMLKWLIDVILPGRRMWLLIGAGSATCAQSATRMAACLRNRCLRVRISPLAPEFLLSNFVQGERLLPARHVFSGSYELR